MQPIPTEIRVSLLRAGHTQKSLATAVGCSRQWLIHVLRGDWRGSDTLRAKIAAKLHQTPEFLDHTIPLKQRSAA